jgi:serine/threonine protein kinase
MSGENRIGQILVETYRIERLIAEGGMGGVYEARHLRLPKRFAVKFLNLALIANTEAQARFRREAEIIAELDHPNIVSLLDYNLTDEGVPYIVLEYLDGEHLGKRVMRGAIPLGEALKVLAPVVAALQAAHARGVVHRDLKPENIVLCKDEQVKVVDFGIAKIRDGQELTRLNTILGTVPYMAPEQLFGAEVSSRTDQFALAAIVYEMLTTEMAFGGPTSVPEVAARVAHYQPPDVPGVPAAVNAALFQALAKDPDARFPSVSDFLEAMVAGAYQLDEPAPLPDLAEEDDDLPPLPGEVTTISLLVPSTPPRRAPPLVARATVTPPAPVIVEEAAPARDAPPPAVAPPVTALPARRAATAPRTLSYPQPVAASAPAAAGVSGVPQRPMSRQNSGPTTRVVLDSSGAAVWVSIAAVLAACAAVVAWLFFHRPW